MKKFIADRLLANPQPPIVEMLLIPELVETRGAGRLDIADRVQIADVVGGQPAPLDLIGARIDFAAPMQAAPQIDAQIEIGEARVQRALPQTAGQIAEDLAGFGNL